MMRSIPKCQALNPELCIHPDCPERKGIREALQKATNYNDYEAAMALQEADNERVRLAKIALNADNAPSPVIALPRVAPSPASIGKNPSGAMQRQQIEAIIRSDIQRYTANDHERNGLPIVKFHKDMGFPWHFKNVTATVPLRYSDHALEESENDRYDKIPILEELNLGESQLIEVKYNHKTGQIEKMMYRKANVKNGLDGCFVLKPSRMRGQAWQVVTAWYNTSNDKHKTLDKKKYSAPKPRKEAQVLQQAA